MSALEYKVISLENSHDHLNFENLVSVAVKAENAALQAHLHDQEERARSENLVFYDIAGFGKESWASAEEKVRELLSKCLGLQLPDDVISRAYRLGPFLSNKCRPIKAWFPSFKVTASVLSQKSKLRGTEVSISEDFCQTT